MGQNFWPCLTCNIFNSDRHRKLQFSDCNLHIVHYKGYKYPSSMLISAELTNRQTCEFFWLIEILTKFDRKKVILPSNPFPRFFKFRMSPKSSMSANKIKYISSTVTEKTVLKVDKNYEIPMFGGSSLPGGPLMSKSITVGRKAVSSSIQSWKDRISMASQSPDNRRQSLTYWNI